MVPEEFAALGKKLELEMDVSERKKAHQRMVDIIEDECPAAALWMEVVWYGSKEYQMEALQLLVHGLRTRQPEFW